MAITVIDPRTNSQRVFQDEASAAQFRASLGAGGGTPAAPGAAAGSDPFAYTGGSLLTPWTQAFQPGRDMNLGYEAYSGGPGNFGYGFTAPNAIAAPTIAGPGNFSYGDFAMPTAETMQQDPGYQFRLNQGMNALQNAAAAKGSLRTGGAFKALMGYGQDMASQEYGNAYGRARDVYGVNRGNAAENFDRNAANSLAVQNANAGNSLRAQEGTAANQMGAAQLGFNVAQGTWDRNQGLARQQYDDLQNWKSNRYGQLLGEYGINRDNFRTNQDTQFGRLMQMGQMGNPAGYAQSMADLFTGRGNAQAAGALGAGNAYGNLFGNLGNGAMDLAAWYANRGARG